ncbi:GTPase [Nocardioides terrisoli]|uniref:GTPase n=1 Tax=Nocardioides terrisoli TaxID=3388267 RepID=UPI00287BBA2A|nr:GTPase [Nocardioides marmorisolisilvae]
MTALLDAARDRLGRRNDLDARVNGLHDAVEASEGRIDEEILAPARTVALRAGQRLRMSARHTVVALAGATGSGKSSTFNALSGLDVAAVGVRRPTTSWTTACVWGRDNPSDLLEWLGIPLRHQVMRDSMLDTGREVADLDGLVLLDLPDHDSTETAHHLEVDRLIELTDLMVWVLDPQKYADAAIHDRFLRPMAAHRDVMMVVLNHIDEVAPGRRQTIMSDVRRLLAADGLGQVPLLAISARTGEGIDDLRREIAKRVAGKAAVRKRIDTDVRRAAEELSTVTGSGKVPALGRPEKASLVDAVADAAGVPVVVDAVRGASVMRSRRATGWPVTAWLSRLRPDPLKRLHLDLSASQRDLVAATRSSLPSADSIQRARVDSALRDLADSVSRPLSVPWSQAVRRASVSRSGDLNDRLDRAVTSTELGVGGLPAWCRVVRLAQWVLLLAALCGGGWLLALAVMGYLKVPQPDTPRYAGLPLPTLLLVGGVVLGVLLALLGRVLVGLGARARARKAERRLRTAVAEVTEELVAAPIEAELDAYRRTREGLDRALG